MKKRSYILMAAMALFLGVGSISAQSSFKAEIPFDFTIGKTALTAGEYVFALPQTGGAPTISVRNTDGKLGAVVLTNYFSPEKAKTSELKFVKVDGRYHLYQLYVAGRDLGQEIGKVRKAAGSEVAARRVDLKPVGTE